MYCKMERKGGQQRRCILCLIKCRQNGGKTKKYHQVAGTGHQHRGRKPSSGASLGPTAHQASGQWMVAQNPKLSSPWIGPSGGLPQMTSLPRCPDTPVPRCPDTQVLRSPDGQAPWQGGWDSCSSGARDTQPREALSCTSEGGWGPDRVQAGAQIGPVPEDAPPRVGGRSCPTPSSFGVPWLTLIGSK